MDIRSSIKKTATVINKLRKLKEDGEINETYRAELTHLNITRSVDAHMAVVVHLYYIESWPIIHAKLKNIVQYKFDLYITLPKHNEIFAATIQEAYPAVNIVSAPNRGRDVLPFLMVAQALDDAGYEYILKIHSKKSTHRSDGQEWLNGMLASLLPKDHAVLEELFKVLEDSKNSFVGPAGQYLPLSVNFEPNGVHMSNILNKIFPSAKVYEVLQTHRDSYGFFAGTMFWVRLETLRPLLKKHFTARQFEAEAGQIDATFAHALERVFCLVAEIQGKNLYEISENRVSKIDYASDNVPDWSDVYIGPKAG